MNNLQNDGWDLRNLKYIKLAPREVNSYRLQEGDILFNRTNSKELVGKCEVFREEGDWVFASYLIRVRLRSDVSPQFVSDFLSTSAGRLQIDRSSRQIIGMTNINAEELKQILVPMPPKERQLELVRALADAKEQRSNKLAHAETLLRQIDNIVLERLGLVLPSAADSKIYAVSSSSIGKRIDAYSNKPRFRDLLAMLSNCGYTVINLRQLAERIFSGTTPLAKGDSYVTPPDGVRFIRSGEITTEGRVTEKSEVHVSDEVHNGILKRSQLVRGDLLIAIVGATIGATGIFDRNEPANINQAVAAVRLKQHLIAPEFARLYLRSGIGQMLLDYFKRPVARANINLEEVGEIPVIVPSMPVQEELIVAGRQRRAGLLRLRVEAESDWQKAKLWFEEQLLRGSQE